MDRHGTRRTLWRAAHALGAAGLFALAAVMALSLPARAQTETAVAAALAAVDICRDAVDTDDLVARLGAAGFRPITQADADAIFDLSTSFDLFMVAAGEAGLGLDAAETAELSDLFAAESANRERKAGLAVRTSAQYPQFLGPSDASFVTVLASTLPLPIGPRHVCEITVPEAPAFADLHAGLAAGGPYSLPADWIDQRAAPDGAPGGGISLSFRIDPDTFQGLYGQVTPARYQFTVHAAPLPDGPARTP